MWKLYEKLIEGISKELVVEDFCVGRTWTLIKSGGQMGMAMTTQGESRPSVLTDNLIGLPLREVAKMVMSWNFIEAGIGMAAINAYYNTSYRQDDLSSAQNNEAFCTQGLDLAQKTIGLIGHLRMPINALDGAKEVYIMERNPHEGDYPDSACEYILPQCDIVIITGSALINKTMPRLLELSKNAFTILAGPTVPMSPVLFDFDVQRLSGMIVSDCEQLKFHVMRSKSHSPYYCGSRFCLENIRK